jgi:hypothetical protein
MEPPVLIVGAAVVVLLVASVLVGVLRSGARSRRELAAALLAAQAETDALRSRLDALTEQMVRQSSSMIRVDDPAYVITDAGSHRLEPTVGDRVVLTATVGEPLVKVVAFGHGVRRALSAESRNKIWFEMRREVRRARKQRRREMKEAWRRMQAEERAAQGDAASKPSPQPADAA